MSYTPSLTPQAVAERQTWQFKVVAYTRGNQSQLGALIVAMLGRKVNPPCFNPLGVKITKAGQVVALYKRDVRSKWSPEMIYENVEAMNVVFRGLAAELKLSDAETEAMFSELRKFVRKDERAVSTL